MRSSSQSLVLPCLILWVVTLFDGSSCDKMLVECGLSVTRIWLRLGRRHVKGACAALEAENMLVAGL